MLIECSADAYVEEVMALFVMKGFIECHYTTQAECLLHYLTMLLVKKYCCVLLYHSFYADGHRPGTVIK